ncbi:MAG: AbrB/MazE/SpoVT family DNA-binding domain-containing protein [Candidatus Shapirobacteria bacterium]
MITHSGTLTSKGQVTIPAQILKSANLKKGHKLSFSFEDGVIRIEPTINMVRRLAGSLKTPKEFVGMDIDKIIKLAKKEHFSNYKL